MYPHISNPLNNSSFTIIISLLSIHFQLHYMDKKIYFTPSFSILLYLFFLCIVMGISIVIPIQSHTECNILMYKIFPILMKNTLFSGWLLRHYDTKTLVFTMVIFSKAFYYNNWWLPLVILWSFNIMTFWKINFLRMINVLAKVSQVDDKRIKTKALASTFLILQSSE